MRYCTNHIIYHQTPVPYRVYQNSADSPCLVMLHGFLASQDCFADMIDKLKQHFTILTIDFPPFGSSFKNPDAVFSYEDYARALKLIMHQEEITDAYFAGHSMGGQIALLIAYRFPKLVRKLFLFAPSSYMLATDKISQFVAGTALFPFLLHKIFEVKSVNSFLENMVANPQSITLRMVIRYAIPFTDPAMYPALAKFIQFRGGDLPNDCLQKINAPADIFWGTADPLLPPVIGQRLQTELRHASLQLIAGAGHLLPEEAPALLCEAIINSKQSASQSG